MTHQETIEANRLLAEFLGFWETEETYFYNPYFEKGYKYEDMLFSSSWDWIMQVVEKIESITVGNELQHEVLMNGCNCRIIDRSGTVIMEYESERTKIDAVYYACVDFVKLYKENKAVQENQKT